MTLGQNISLSRKKKGISQEELSNLLKVSRQSVSLWENDQTIPTIDKLKEISTYLEVSVDLLLGLVYENKNNEKQEKGKVHESKSLLIVSLIFTTIGVLLWQVFVLSIILNVASTIINIIYRKSNKEKFLPIALLIISIVFLIASICGSTIL